MRCPHEAVVPLWDRCSCQEWAVCRESVRSMCPTTKPVGVHVHVSSSRVPGSCECESCHDGISFHGNAAPPAGGLLLPLHPAADRPLRHGHERRVRVQVKTNSNLAELLLSKLTSTRLSCAIAMGMLTCWRRWCRAREVKRSQMMATRLGSGPTRLRSRQGQRRN